jgi:hypothetical protein
MPCIRGNHYDQPIENDGPTEESGTWCCVDILFALLILTAVTASLIMFTGTETSVNYNYRTEEISFFAAKSGIYEALDRMQQTNASSISASIPIVPPSATGGVLYIINAGSSLTVRPWDPTNAYFDNEFCHEGYSIAGMTATSPDIPCTTVPTGTTWYTTVTSNFPWSGTSTAMPYEWVRINWKQNSTQAYLTGGTTPVTSYYSVNSGRSSTTPACWNGASEVLLSTPAGVSPAYQRCEEYQTCSAVSPSITTPVLMITSLAVTSNGSRQMVQAEAALNPPSVTVPACGLSDAYGFFAYGAGFSCSSPAFNIAGNAFVDGYNSANGPYSSSTNHNLLLGDIGTNQGLVAAGSSTNIGGTVYVPSVGGATPPGPGSCPGDDFSVSGNPGYHALAQSQVIAKPTITVPPDNSNTDESTGTLVPGTYRNLSVGSHGAVVLTAPGTYVFDCITLGSFGTVTTSPANRTVAIYVTGTGCASAPLSMNSHAQLVNTSGISQNLQINYAGTGTITMEGGPNMCAVVNAPNAAVTLHGGADYFGTIMANSVDDSGGTSLHFDAADTTLSGVSASTATATATGSYNTLAFHPLSY